MGPPWMGGMPFAGFPGFPGRPRAGRGRGDVRLAVLGLLAEQPRHGYDLIQQIAARSNGTWRPSPGSVYPTLSQLEDEGLVAVDPAEGKRVYTLTEAGREQALARADDFAALWEDEPFQGTPHDMWPLLMQVAGAAMQVVHAGTEQQRAAAADILSRARRDLYLLLADDEEEAAP